MPASQIAILSAATILIPVLLRFIYVQLRKSLALYRLTKSELNELDYAEKRVVRLHTSVNFNWPIVVDGSVAHIPPSEEEAAKIADFGA